ncbi:PREDICTED: nudix hydrolase 24, chloroplastic-like, partial [Nanorana parkeri]|uniref:nudix hydrolase 24, chloroplastic-like n=1 Tax=Nanorana parkeri TaxID=125878 RepID=UPI0008543583
LYDVRGLFSDPPLFSMERAATPLLGAPQYGVHVNGYVDRGGEIFMWVARRALSKATYPGKLDHLAAGGISAGCGVWETLLKECREEACVPESLAATARPCGTVSLMQVRDAVATEEFKPNCALVVLDFLLRRGHIQPDTEKFYTKFVELLHSPL